MVLEVERSLRWRDETTVLRTSVYMCVCVCQSESVSVSVYICSSLASR